MIRRYLLSSAALHFSLLGFILLSPWFHRSPNVFFIDGFEYLGDGGGGDGKSGGGMKPDQMGQVVPQPVKIPIPDKPAPIQKAQKAEEEWSVQEKVKTPVKSTEKTESNIEVGDKKQEEKTNIIRRGIDPNAKTGDGGFDFGPDEGGKGKGLGIGFGPGEGGGFGGFSSYLKIVRQRIWSEWTQSAVYGSQQVCIVGLTISRSGDISDIKVEKASGNPFYDSVALRAVRNSSPLPPLPSGLSSTEQRFRIQFRLLD
jgi:protein TonB